MRETERKRERREKSKFKEAMQTEGVKWPNLRF